MKKLTLRCLCIILIASMILPIIPSAFAASFPFTDVSPNYIYYEAIKYVYDHNIMLGVTPTTFCPYTNLTRGMAVTVLYRMSHSSLQHAPVGFTDVPSSAYYYYPVGWAQYYGIVNGTSPTTFEPESLLTRQQFLVMLYRYATEYEGYSYSLVSGSYVNALADYNSISVYARTAINWALNCGILPVTTSYCYPNNNVNRGLTANFLYIFLSTVLGDRKSLAIRQYSPSTVAGIRYEMEMMGVGNVCAGYDLSPRAFEFALRNSDMLYLYTEGGTNYINLSGGSLYSADIAYNTLGDLDLVYISSKYGGASFASALYNKGKANCVVGFNGEISSTSDSDGIHFFNYRVFYNIRRGCSLSLAVKNAQYEIIEAEGSSCGADSIVVYGQYNPID